MRIRCALFSIIFLVPLAAFAQSSADDDLVDRELSSVLTGLTTLDAAGAPATNRDYLSFFVAALESLSQSKGESITFDWNFKVTADDAIKAQLVLRKPALVTTLATKLASNNAAALEALKGELSFDDDVALTISYAPSAAKAKTEARAALSTELSSLRGFVRAEALANAAALAKAAEDAATALDDASQSKKTVELAITAAALSNVAVTAAALADVDRIVAEMAEPLAEFIALDKTDVSKFTYDIYARSRHETAGPDELKIKARYESPFRKSNTVSNRLRAINGAAVAGGVTILGADVSGMRSTQIAEALRTAAQQEPQDRWVASLDLQWVTKNDIALPQYLTEPLRAASSRSVSFSLSAGRDLFRPKTVDRRGRVDAELKYDDVTGDKQRHDRLVASVTYTQKLSEKVNIPVSLSYANHSDYLTNVNRKLNAHFGLSWKLPGM